jgi:hypothetical protein
MSLPSDITDNCLASLRKQMHKAYKESYELIHECYARLARRRDTHVMFEMECRQCGTCTDLSSQTCPDCLGTNLRDRYCSLEVRVSGFCSIIHGKLLPLPTSESLSSICQTLEDGGRLMKHRCTLNEECPLRVEMRTLLRSMRRVLQTLDLDALGN